MASGLSESSSPSMPTSANIDISWAARNCSPKKTPSQHVTNITSTKTPMRAIRLAIAREEASGARASRRVLNNGGQRGTCIGAITLLPLMRNASARRPAIESLSQNGYGPDRNHCVRHLAILPYLSCFSLWTRTPTRARTTSNFAVISWRHCGSQAAQQQAARQELYRDPRRTAAGEAYQ